MIYKNIIVFSVLILLFLLPACKKNVPEVVIYNNTLVKFKMQADSSFISSNEKIINSLPDRDYHIIQDIVSLGIKDMEKYIGNVKYSTFTPDEEDLKNAIIYYIKSLSDVLASYRSYRILTEENVTREQIDSINDLIKQAEEKNNTILQTVVSAQKEYAQRNNIQFEKKSTFKLNKIK